MSLPLSVPQRHSIWLCPEPDVVRSFDAEIATLSARAGTDPFEPHVTLLGDLATAPDATLEACRTHIASLGPIRAEVSGVTQTNAYYMALFLDVAVSPAIDGARMAIEHDLGEVSGEPLRPHLSLAYGLVPEALTPAEKRRLQERFSGLCFALSHVTLVSAAKGVPVSDWRVLCSIPLASH